MSCRCGAKFIFKGVALCGWKRDLTHTILGKGSSLTVSGKKTFVSSKYFYLSKMSDSEKDLIAKAELKKRLTPVQYHVTQEKGTERAFTGKYYKTTDAGTYTCVVCGEELFSSETKFESGCGWPAFSDVLDQGKVKLTKDTSHVGGNLLLLIANPGMIRTEVTCVNCGAHLGHVFNDGPKPKLRRFCINSASLNFHPADGSSTAEEDVTMNGQ